CDMIKKFPASSPFLLWFRNVSLLAGSACLLAACTSLAPDYERPQPPIPEHFSQDEAADASVSAVADIAWQDYFTDAELQELIHKALTDNRDLRSAVLRVQEAQAAYGISRADQLPAIGAGLDSQRGLIPGDLSPTGQPRVAGQHQLGVG